MTNTIIYAHPDVKAHIIAAHLQGWPAGVIAYDERISIEDAQRIIDEYEADEKAVREEWQRIDRLMGKAPRMPEVDVAATSEGVIHLYINTDLSRAQIARECKMKVDDVRYIIEDYDERVDEKRKIQYTKINS